MLLSFVCYTNSFSQNIIIDEDFQAGFPAGWKTVINDTSNIHPDVSEFTSAWIVKENPDTIADSVMASTSYFQNGGIASRWVITDQIQLGTYGNFLKWDTKSHDPSFPDGYKVLISITNDSLHNFTDTLFHTDFEVPTWTTREYQLVDSIYSGQQIYIAFVNDSDDQYILYIDNVVVRGDDPLSVDENDFTSNTTIYPNPFTDRIQLKTDQEIIGISLFDLNGRLMRQQREEIYIVEDLGAYKPGVYFLQIQYKNGLNETKKLIKE
jgi:hypothetical protein